VTTPGRLLIEEALPPELRHKVPAELTKKTLASLLQEVATSFPEKYRDVSHALTQAGRDAAYSSGGYSFGLRHLLVSPAAIPHREQVRKEVDRILADQSLSTTDKEKAIVKAAGRVREPMEKAVMEEGLKEGNPLALQIASGSKGNPSNLRSLRGGDLLYVDQNDREVPIPVLRSYAEGLDPASYFAGTYGGRRGVVDVKKGTRDAGYLGKRLQQATHRLIVTAKDSPHPHEPDRPMGLPVDVSDPDNEGAYLAASAGGYPRNTHLSPRLLSELRSKGIDHLLVRSPIAGGPADGGVYAYDVGVRERGGLTPVGDYVGLSAAQSVGEPLSQMSLCLAEGTLVRMADWTTRPIESICPGEEVMGADIAGRAFPVRVTNTYANGLRDCVRTVFHVSRSKEAIDLVSTPDHKILATTHYWALPHNKKVTGVQPVGVKALRLGARMTTSVDYDRGSPEPFALLLGLLLGDGCHVPSVGGVYLSCFDTSLMEDIATYLDGLGLRAKLCAGQRGYWRINSKVDPVRQDPTMGRMLPGSRNVAKSVLCKYRMYGKYAHEKEIPDEVWSWDQQSVRDLISGLFVTDGSVYVATQNRDVGAAYVAFGSTSLPLVARLRELLQVRFAIYTSQIGRTDSGRKGTLYSFTISRREEVAKFSNLIPLYGVKKRVLADRLTAQQSAKYDDNGGKYHRKRQEPVGCLPTYDLEVDHSDHLFVLANGLIVSNSSKHKGGVAGTMGGVSGFKLIDQLVSIPQEFPGGAAHAQKDGKVESVEPAAQGGHYVTVGGEPHYVPHGRDITAKVGDEVEAGDPLSEGVPNPAELVKHKGVGEGRRRFVELFRQTAANASTILHRRNVELLARGLINHVRLTEESGDHVPGDVVPYHTLAASYEPRPGHEAVALKAALGKYLERPVLHYSIGTQVKRSHLPVLERHGVHQLTVHAEPPPFEPVMLRSQDTLAADPDWMTQMLGSNLEKHLLHAAHTGAISDRTGSSFVPALAEGKHFGLEGLTKGWKPGNVEPAE
jgi:hypothetical protein